MKEIPLTQGRVALVDDQDYEALRIYRWQFSNTHYGYAKRTVRVGTKFKTVYMHQVIAASAGLVDVDHRNYNGLDNQRGNLRPCTTAQNCRHSRPAKGAVSRFKGVYRNRKRWTAQIQCDGVRRYLGTFDTQEEAAAVYDRAAQEMDPEFSFLNAAIVHDGADYLQGGNPR